MSIKNMFESILSDDGDGGEAQTETVDADGTGGDGGMTDGGGLMAEEGGDEFGDLGGLDDDEDGGFGDDEFGDMDDAGANNDELEHRLDELENEVGSLSSTVNTVRTENEQISDSVEEVEENVRKLLDIYEMVTRGVNPFADDIDAGVGGGMGDSGSFGLFADEDGGDSGGEDLDEDIADADAEGFFDEDLVEEPSGGDPSGGDGSTEGGVDDMFPEEETSESTDEPEATFDEDFDDGEEFDEFEDDPEESDDGGGGGKSFQELKDEYEGGDAEWAGEGEAPDEAEAATDDVEAAEADVEGGGDDGDGLEDDELFDEVIEDDGIEDEPAAETNVEAETTVDDGSDGEAASAEPSVSEAEPEQTPTPTHDETAAADTGPATSPAHTPQASDGDKPYLASLPGGFATDMIVVEWLEYLTDVSGYRETARAIDYYEDIDWIGSDVADELQEYLRGFDEVDGDGDGLTIDDHTTSLEYISQLDGGGGPSIALSKLQSGGGGRGLQR